MKPFALRISAFSISWLRAYDFGLEHEALESTLPNLTNHPLFVHLTHVGEQSERDEIDVNLFDVRYLHVTKLVRIHLLPFQLVAQELGTKRQLTTEVRVSLLMDGGSGFGVFNLCLSQPNSQGADSFSIDEITFLTRQWLLAKDQAGRPVRLKVRLPGMQEVKLLYLREVMNYYFLQVHRSLWQASWDKYDRQPVDQNWYLKRCDEQDGIGFGYLQLPHHLKRVQSLFPSSFGPVLSIWGIEGLDPSKFNWRVFSRDYMHEVSWLFTDGRDTDLGGEHVELRNEESRESRALFVWPNHAIYIDQAPDFIRGEKGIERIDKYGLVDMELVRIFEVLTLQGAMVHAFDSKLDEMLKEVSSGTANDSKDIVRIIQQRRRITRSIRTFDYFNLFHGGAQLEALYRRLLDNPGLEYTTATDLVEAKARRLDEEIGQSVIIQNREILEGIRQLTLSNERQTRALASITIVVSVITALSFTEVILTLVLPSISLNSWQVALLKTVIFFIMLGILWRWFMRRVE